MQVQNTHYPNLISEGDHNHSFCGFQTRVYVYTQRGALNQKKFKPSTQPYRPGIGLEKIAVRSM